MITCLCYFYFIYFYGCRVQINKPHTITITFFIQPKRIMFWPALVRGFFVCLFVSGQAGNIWSLWMSVSYQNLMRKQAGEYIPGVFPKSFFHVIALPSALLIPSP